MEQGWRYFALKGAQTARLRIHLVLSAIHSVAATMTVCTQSDQLGCHCAKQGAARTGHQHEAGFVGKLGVEGAENETQHHSGR